MNPLVLVAVLVIAVLLLSRRPTTRSRVPEAFYARPSSPPPAPAPSPTDQKHQIEAAIGGAAGGILGAWYGGPAGAAAGAAIGAATTPIVADAHEWAWGETFGKLF